LPESDSDDEFCSKHQPDDRRKDAHSTYSDDNAHLLADQQQDSSVFSCETARENRKILLPQATAPSGDSREVLLAPEIESDFGDKPMIELASYY